MTEKAFRPVLTVSVPGGTINVAGNDHTSARTGSLGWNFNQSITDNKGVKYQLTGNLTINGTSKDSKNISPEDKAAAEERAKVATAAQLARAK